MPVIIKSHNNKWTTAPAPLVNNDYLVTIKGATRPTILYYDDGKWIDDRDTEYEIAAWMPLPPTYSEEELWEK